MVVLPAETDRGQPAVPEAVWLAAADGKLYYRDGLAAACPEGRTWRLMEAPGIAYLAAASTCVLGRGYCSCCDLLFCDLLRYCYATKVCMCVVSFAIQAPCQA